MLREKLKEKLGRRLTVEQIALAQQNEDKEFRSGDVHKMTKYRLFPGGIRIEEETSISNQLLETRIRDFDLNYYLMTKCTILYQDNRVDIKVTTMYEPPGKLIGKTNVSVPAQMY